jgi:rod shape-determining protein MreC
VGNLVGRIVEAFPMSARVLYLVDPESKANAIVQLANSRARGVVLGRPGDELLLRFVPQSEIVQPGDTVVTSGLGGTFPPGRVIGRVSDVRRNDVDPFQEIAVESAVQFTRLELVQVQTNFIPARVD